EEAGAYLRTLRAILQYLEICDGNMEEGSFRCDANVSVRPQRADTLGTKVEIKNLNSFKAVEKAIVFEIRRHIETLSEGGTVIQETRLWDADREETRPMRTKEFAHDYRYFPDPDLLPVIIDEQWIDTIRAALPELPEARKIRFISRYEIPTYDAELLTSRRDIADYFESALETHRNPKALANWILGDLFRVLKERKLDEKLYITDWPVRADDLANMIALIDRGTISGKIAKTVFDAMLDSGRSPQEIVTEKGLEQVSDSETIERAIDQVLAAHPKQAADYRAGNEKIFGFLVGQIMKATQGRVNPQKANESLKRKLTQEG
ncbi:MAG TPA: Asp-tRNA(Asn)/Glu-tRNA(Gln) amidotransferase subunit GatB, partial [Candidatus Binatia bacterium]|nr:Asp-tRNA(Asn)/Glu-tRNA(Gln) amidotransferase subunit GatB [Candidatus Binatia bacterium]